MRCYALKVRCFTTILCTDLEYLLRIFACMRLFFFRESSLCLLGTIGACFHTTYYSPSMCVLFFVLLQCTHAIECHVRLEYTPVWDPDHQACTEEELTEAGGVDTREGAMELLNKERDRLRYKISREESRVLVRIASLCLAAAGCEGMGAMCSASMEAVID